MRTEASIAVYDGLSNFHRQPPAAQHVSIRQSEMPAESGVSWITLFAGLGIGSIVAAVVGRWSAKAVTISNHRQNWINSLRDDIVMFLQEIDRIRHFLSEAAHKPDPLSERSNSKNLYEARNSALLVYRRILLRLNMTEQPHIELGESLNNLLATNETIPDTKKIDAIVSLSRKILKHEWAVAKYGIFAKPITFLKNFLK
ncbi:hypothetical protein [Bradyrhizobium sp.]